MSNFKMVDDRNKRENRIPLSPKIRYEVLRRDGFTCQYCGRTADERELEIDHIVPYSKGGTNDLGNLQVSCRECNRGKRADNLIENDCDVRVIEKIVYKEIPVEKIVYKEKSTEKSGIGELIDGTDKSKNSSFKIDEIVRLAAEAKAAVLIEKIEAGELVYEEVMAELRA